MSEVERECWCAVGLDAEGYVTVEGTRVMREEVGELSSAAVRLFARSRWELGVVPVIRFAALSEEERRGLTGNFVDVAATAAALEQSRMVEQLLGLEAAAAVDGSWSGAPEAEEARAGWAVVWDEGGHQVGGVVYGVG